MFAWVLHDYAPLFQPIRRKTKTNRDSVAYVFPRIHVFALSFDRLTGLSMCFVIGQCDYFGLRNVRRPYTGYSIENHSNNDNKL